MFNKLILIVTEVLLKIVKLGGPEAKELGLRLADTALDFFEEKAAGTGTKIDDELLRLLRTKLGVPEFEVRPAVEGGE